MKNLFTLILLTFLVLSVKSQTSLTLEAGTTLNITKNQQVALMIGHTNYKEDVGSIGLVFKNYDQYFLWGFRINGIIALSNSPFFFFGQSDIMIGPNLSTEKERSLDLAFYNRSPYPALQIGAGLGVMYKQIRLSAGVNVQENDPIKHFMPFPAYILKTSYNFKFHNTDHK